MGGPFAKKKKSWESIKKELPVCNSMKNIKKLLFVLLLFITLYFTNWSAGVNFTNMFMCIIYECRSQKLNKTVESLLSFCTFGIFKGQYHKHFFYESDLHSFSQIFTFWLWNFLHKNIDAKGACRMLIKFTPGVNFINIPLAAFVHTDLKRAKKNDSLNVFLRIWDLPV